MDQKLGFEELFSNDLLKAVGILFITAAGAETTIGLQLIRLISHPQKFDPVRLLPATAGMEMKTRLGIIRTVAAHISPDCGPKISRITSKIQDAFERRNEIAHNMGIRGRSPDHIFLTLLRFQGDGNLTPPKTFHTKQIRMFAFLMQERLKSLDKAITAMGVQKIAELPVQGTGRASPTSL